MRAATVVRCVAEECENLVATRVCIGSAHLDELTTEVAVEEQVAREIRFVTDADVERGRRGAS